MKDEKKTKAQLIYELVELRQQIHGLEKLEIQRKQTEEMLERLNHQNELILNAGGEGIFGLDTYEGDTVVNSFVVSTGTWMTPTVTGKYKIYVKYRKTSMSGPGYYLPDVPYVMYFYKGYCLHGTYWHNNFGTPMSHGCVNLSIPDAEWLYNWASEGTVVNVH